MTGVHPDQFVPLAVVSRSGVDESVHFGALVALNPDGTTAFAMGDPHVTIFPRSATKPLQALAMVRSGLSLPPELLALVCASHNGEQVHQDTARAILATVGLDESALMNTPDWPLHAGSMRAAIRDGIARSPLQMNCSGKHSGMVATCVVNGWPVDSYLDQDHPLQRAITDVVIELTGAEPPAIATDGCGAPAHMVDLTGLAHAVRAIATGGAGESGTQIFRAMSGHPHIVAGTGRHNTDIVANVPGLFAKDGAESVYVAATSSGHAVVLKLSDGSGRATPTVLLAALDRLGVDVSGVPESVTEHVYGHGRPVGGVRAIGF